MRDAQRLRDFEPIYHPAGFDGALRRALEDLQAGHWWATRDLLLRTGTDWPLRTSRTQVLAAAAARSDVAEAWLSEDRRSPEALLLHARVLVERALQAHRSGHDERYQLASLAREACRGAGEAAPADPVPWVGLMALAQVDRETRFTEHWRGPWEQMLPGGPWGLLYYVHQRHPVNREAYHRMLQFLYSCRWTSNADALSFAQWAASTADPGSPLRILPLYAWVENYRQRRESGSTDVLTDRQWANEPVIWDVQRAHEGWVAKPASARSVGDCNYLAHALWAACQYVEAGEVFQCLGDLATQAPWIHLTDEPGRPDLARALFVRARAECLSPARKRSARGSAHRPRFA
ncbi:hypothetical protein [Streptomyces sp. NPDC050485]|uniref:hypothetical protein n=1 Tax=Streptomyces sp. NPDC050485 TaxID=3365617 RepID=UPI00379E0AD0